MRTIGNILFVGMLVMNYVGLLPAEQKSPAILLQEALYQEETEGNLDKAMELYGQVLQQAADVERVAARAAYQLGLCHLKKDNPTEAAAYFRKVVSDYPKQASIVKKAQAQLGKIAPAEQAILFEELPEAVLMEIGNMYGQTAARAGLQSLYTNSNIHYVNSDFVSYRGGYGYYTNHLNTPLTQKVRLSGTSYPNQYHYDIAGRRMNTDIVPDDKRENFYHIYWTPEEALAPGQFFMYGWCVTDANKVPMAPGSTEKSPRHMVTIQNHFGNHAFEVFYLVIPNELQVTETSDPQTEVKTVGNYTIHAWEKEVQPDENHRVTAYLQRMRDVSPEEIKSIVEKAVVTISTCNETDPRIKDSLASLKGIPEEPLLTELSSYLDSETDTIRRAAVYIFWQGQFANLPAAAREKLTGLLGHPENFTRGMAAIALGANKAADAYDAIAEMALNDSDGYARRCAAYALGLLGDKKALEVLDEVLKDSDSMVKANAQAAITMLNAETPAQSGSETTDPEPKFTQEMYNDIQPDGTIRFSSPQPVRNDGSEPITERRFNNSDFVQLTAMTDEQGNPVEFTATHEGNRYRYRVVFDPPIMPGETFVYYSEGTISGLIQPVTGEDNTYRYRMSHSPSTGVPTLRIEEYLLPEGAELISTVSEMEQSEQGGRILLRVEEIIPAGGSLLTSFKYRLEPR